MASDPPTDPGLKFRSSVTPEATAQADQHIGVEGNLILPDVVPIVNPELATPFGHWLNRWWIRTHFLARGVAGTFCEWFIFIVGAASQYPKVSVCLLALGTVFTEEKFSEQPILTNIMSYAMHSYDPDAADKIFAERPTERDPIGKAAKKAVETATKEFMDSAAYQELQEEIAQDVARQTRRQAYMAAGMTEDVKAVDEEIRVARVERREARAAKRAAEEPEAAPVVTVPVRAVHAVEGAVALEDAPFEAQEEASPTEQIIEEYVPTEEPSAAP